MFRGSPLPTSGRLENILDWSRACMQHVCSMQQMPPSGSRMAAAVGFCKALSPFCTAAASASQLRAAGDYLGSLTGSNLVSLAGSRLPAANPAQHRAQPFPAELDFVFIELLKGPWFSAPDVKKEWGPTKERHGARFPQGLGHSKPGSHGTRTDP
ncbi:hypothetical protein E2320_007195 [Naja naja]|nr:hypothetical protein E2320_007195 [Naja naja]